MPQIKDHHLHQNCLTNIFSMHPFISKLCAREAEADIVPHGTSGALVFAPMFNLHDTKAS